METGPLCSPRQTPLRHSFALRVASSDSPRAARVTKRPKAARAKRPTAPPAPAALVSARPLAVAPQVYDTGTTCEDKFAKVGGPPSAAFRALQLPRRGPGLTRQALPAHRVLGQADCYLDLGNATAVEEGGIRTIVNDYNMCVPRPFHALGRPNADMGLPRFGVSADGRGRCLARPWQRLAGFSSPW